MHAGWVGGAEEGLLAEVSDAAGFEGAGGLEGFEFEEDSSCSLGEVGRLDERRFAPGLVLDRHAGRLALDCCVCIGVGVWEW